MYEIIRLMFFETNDTS